MQLSTFIASASMIGLSFLVPVPGQSQVQVIQEVNHDYFQVVFLILGRGVCLLRRFNIQDRLLGAALAPVKIATTLVPIA